MDVGVQCDVPELPQVLPEERRPDGVRQERRGLRPAGCAFAMPLCPVPMCTTGTPDVPELAPMVGETLS